MLDFGRDAIQAMVIKYISEHLREQRKLGHGSIKLHVAGLYYFLDGEDIILNRQKIRRHYPRDDFIHDDRCYTREEIQSILSKCDERTRAMVLLMVSSGMRIGALRELQIGDLTKALVPNLNLSLFKIWVYARSRDRYYTFCTPECRAAVLDYLATRERFGEDITKKTSPLFREQYNLADHLRIQSPRFQSRRTIIYLVNEALKRSGIKTSEVMPSHGMRKFTVSMMIKAKLDYDAREYLVGHKASRGLGQNYDRTTEDDRLTEFLRAVDLLTISNEYRLKKQLETVELRHSAEWEALKAQMNELRNLLNQKV